MQCVCTKEKQEKAAFEKQILTSSVPSSTKLYSSFLSERSSPHLFSRISALLSLVSFCVVSCLFALRQGATCAILEHLEVDPHCRGFSGSGGATSACDRSASATAAPLSAAAAAGSAGQDQGRGVRLFNAEALQRYTLMCAQQFPDGISY